MAEETRIADDSRHALTRLDTLMDALDDAVRNLRAEIERQREDGEGGDGGRPGDAGAGG